MSHHVLILGIREPMKYVVRTSLLAIFVLDAFEKLVDRVLSNPHYGERWGRHWLDQARYAIGMLVCPTAPAKPYVWKLQNRAECGRFKLT